MKEVTKDEVIAEDGRRFACSPGAVLWATGAEPHGLHSVLEVCLCVVWIACFSRLLEIGLFYLLFLVYLLNRNEASL